MRAYSYMPKHHKAKWCTTLIINYYAPGHDKPHQFLGLHQFEMASYIFSQGEDSDNILNKHDVIKRQSDQKCQCKDGSPGPRGNKGEKGMEGKQGRKGDTGSRGPRGDVGDRGQRGSIGIQSYNQQL